MTQNFAIIALSPNLTCLAIDTFSHRPTRPLQIWNEAVSGISSIGQTKPSDSKVERWHDCFEDWICDYLILLCWCCYYWCYFSWTITHIIEQVYNRTGLLVFSSPRDTAFRGQQISFLLVLTALQSSFIVSRFQEDPQICCGLLWCCRRYSTLRFFQKTNFRRIHVQYVSWYVSPSKRSP